MRSGGRIAGWFTLVEVVIAIAILGLCLGGLLQLLSAGQLTLARGMDKWHYMHMLTQAAEYLMLQSEEELEVPDEFFPYDGYTVVCELDDIEDIPEDYNNLDSQLPLKAYSIELIRESDRKVVESVIIDRICFDYEVDEEASGTDNQ